MTRPFSLIGLGLIAAASLLATASQACAHPFSMPMSEDDSRWRVVVDGVMGGLSSGRVEQRASGLRFSGDLRLENNGGFSQIRSPIERGALEGADGIEIEVRGDGRSYIFDARVADMRMDASSFQQTFDTADDAWITVRLPFKGFRFHSFGRLVPGVDAIEAAMIESLGVTLADKNAGDFVLEIRAFRGYAQGDERDRRLAQLVQGLGLDGIHLEGGREGGREEGREGGNEPARDERARRLAALSENLGVQAQAQRSEPAPRAMASVSFGRRVSGLCVLAIERGATLFNAGQPAACAAVYELTLASIVELGADELDDRTLGMLSRTLRDGQQIHDAGARAWHYRRAIDALIERFNAHA